MHTFLSANGLQEFTNSFIKQKIDLDTLMDMSEANIKDLGLPSRYRQRLIDAIAERKNALEDPGEIDDSYL